MRRFVLGTMRPLSVFLLPLLPDVYTLQFTHIAAAAAAPLTAAEKKTDAGVVGHRGPLSRSLARALYFRRAESERRRWTVHAAGVAK